MISTHTHRDDDMQSTYSAMTADQSTFSVDSDGSEESEGEEVFNSPKRTPAESFKMEQNLNHMSGGEN